MSATEPRPSSPAGKQPKPPELGSEIACPQCGHRKVEQMATDACQFSYDCESCGTLLRPRSGDCWVFCSYGSVPCPPIQSPAANADPRAAQKGKTLIGADNVFKLAVATAIVLFGLNLGATLVTVADVLVEVLVMLSVSLTRPGRVRAWRVTAPSVRPQP